MNTKGNIGMMKPMAWAGVIFLGLGAVALGNGGGYYRGGVEVAGDVQGFEPEKTEQVQIVDELLKVRLHESYADVEVNYVMRHIGEAPVKVRFGFPVEKSVLKYYNADKLEMESEDRRYCEQYQITENGTLVKAEWQGERQKSGIQNTSFFDDFDHEFDNISGWLISELEFTTGETKKVQITFRSLYPERGWGLGNTYERNATKFVYRLSTAAVWGGPIARGRIELIPEGIPTEELRVTKPHNRFKQEGKMWVWEFENLEPSMSDDFEVETRAKEVSYEMYPNGRDDLGVGYVKRGEHWFMQSSYYNVRASSVLAPQGKNSYEPELLKTYKGVWSEGASGSGEGEWLKIAPKEALPLRYIRILPGHAGKERFNANARPKKVEVLLNGEHRFEVELRDEMIEQDIAVIDYAEPVKSVKLTFLEVYPGTEFEDLCIRRIRLESPLDEEPEVKLIEVG